MPDELKGIAAPLAVPRGVVQFGTEMLLLGAMLTGKDEVRVWTLILPQVLCK